MIADMRRTALAILALIGATGAIAQEAAPRIDCDRVRVALPPELAGWSADVPVTAGGSAGAAASIAVGKGALAKLLPATGIKWATKPGKNGGAAGHSGLLAFRVAMPGRYRIALGAGAWIDVVQGSKALTSVAHGHGPQCTGVHKMVDFDLKPGRYILQIAGNKEATLPLLVARLPR